MKLRLVAALALALFCTASGSEALAQTNAVPAKTGGAAQKAEKGGKRGKMGSELKLTGEEEKLMRGSKAAIIVTGMSVTYFDEHFSLVRVVNTQGSRQVVWKYSLGEYETTLTDIVGFYTSGGARVDTHSITGTLGSTSDIRKTIPMPRAEKIMRECIGGYAGAAVVFQRLSADGQTGLYLIAESSDIAPLDAGREMREQAAEQARERERKEREKLLRPEAQKGSPGGATSGEPVKMKDKKELGPPFFIGYVNLETGKCLKARGIRGQGITR
ncbi:MAG: hypothetical protein H0T60_07520 [Acidobacteria bacterium]|nr:hypothetical protein [Acidobacteriota bacterium]